MAEHDLIMNHNAVASPEETLTRVTGDNRDLQYARAVHAVDVRKRLTSLDLGDITFWETGTVTVQLNLGGKPQLVDFAIKSVSDEMMRKLAEELTKINARIPTKYDPESKTRVHDESHPSYEKITMDFLEANRVYEFKKLLHGLDMKLEYNGRTIWNPNDDQEQDYDSAIARLNAIGIRTSDIKTIVAAIDALSNKAIETDQEEFIKK